MSVAALGWGITQTVGSGTRKAVLMALCNYANQDGESWPSVRRICRDTEFSERAVQKALRELVESGIVSREDREAENGAAQSALYLLPITTAKSRGQDVQGRGHGVQGRGHMTAPPPGHDVPHHYVEPPLRTSKAPLSSASLQKEEAPAEPDADPRKVLFSRGLSELRKLTGMPEPKMRTLFGKWLRDAGDNAFAVMRAIDEAVESEPAEPVSFIAGRLGRSCANGRPPWGPPRRDVRRMPC